MSVAVWFDGDFSDSYFAEGHVSPEEFLAAGLVCGNDSCGPFEEVESVDELHVEHLWATPHDPVPFRGLTLDDYERFDLHKTDPGGTLVWPVTRWQP